MNNLFKIFEKKKTYKNYQKKKYKKNKVETYLPVTKGDFIPVPNVILRSSLFGIVKKGSRKFEKNVLKTTVNGYTVKYTGEQLDQADLDVWLECLKRCQKVPLGYNVKFPAYSFLQSIGRNKGKKDYLWLKSVFQRLLANSIEISDGKHTYIGSLIFEQYRDENKGEICLVLNKKIVSCFGKNIWTAIKKEIRFKLRGKPLTQWLYGFYSTHSFPFPIKISTLKFISGSDARLKEFKRMIKKSLIELSSTTGWSCNIDDTDKIIILKKDIKNKIFLQKLFKIPKGFRK